MLSDEIQYISFTGIIKSQLYINGNHSSIKYILFVLTIRYGFERSIILNKYD